MSRFFICGDPHGEFDHILHAVETEHPDAVILLGDMELPAPLDVVFRRIRERVPIWWIQGNHDTEKEESYDFLYNSALSTNCIHGRVVEICGVRVAGIGGVFRSKIWTGKDARYRSQMDYIESCGKGNHWRGGLPLRHRSTIFPSDIANLSIERADILVTHEAPGAHPHGNVALTELAHQLGVQAAFHGHHHETISYPGGIWHGVGLRQIYRFDSSAPDSPSYIWEVNRYL